MKKTKKNYEIYLNEIGKPEHEGRCKSKNYGTWLRRNDPIAFSVGFNEWEGR